MRERIQKRTEKGSISLGWVPVFGQRRWEGLRRSCMMANPKRRRREWWRGVNQLCCVHLSASVTGGNLLCSVCGYPHQHKHSASHWKLWVEKENWQTWTKTKGRKKTTSLRTNKFITSQRDDEPEKVGNHWEGWREEGREGERELSEGRAWACFLNVT